MDDSPAPFVRIRPPPSPEDAAYQRGLDLAGHVHRLLEDATRVRFHLEDRLDRGVTALVLELGRAAADVRVGRWRYYRKAQRLATDCAAVLDILDRQAVTRQDAGREEVGPGDHLAAARAALRRLCDDLVPLAAR